jgi:hypothetical protein
MLPTAGQECGLECLSGGCFDGGGREFAIDPGAKGPVYSLLIRPEGDLNKTQFRELRYRHLENGALDS